MDEEIDRLVIGVHADTSGFARDVAAMRDALDEGLGGAAGRAARTIDSALARAVRTGKLGFDDLGKTALTVLNEIARASLGQGVKSVLGGGGGIASLATALIGAAFGLPGRATGGPVSPGAAYLVGERGPELFVPTSSGAVRAIGGGGAGRDVRVAITVNAPNGGEPAALARSGRQVARAVTRALQDAER